ncbi:MAG: hypothetical protein E7434_06230 [Ruminococcaceae bacterium]|nr:hypothetical protein [Oscillospiraceae bacterium]
MKVSKIYRSLFSMLLVLALLVSCVGTAFATNEATENEIAVTVEESAPATKSVATKSSASNTIVGDWLNASTLGSRGAANLMADYAKLGITDVYLLVKGTAGKLAWKSNVANTVTTSEVSAYGDLLKQACEAAKPYGIRVHAWMMAGHDDHYMNNIDSSAMAYHFRVGYSSSVNQRLNLRDEGYRAYTSELVKEIVENYDVAGIHLDCIRYFALYYDWGQNARDTLLTKYGITIAQYNAATKAMCSTGGYSYTTKTTSTAGYNNGASYSYVAYSSSGTSASSLAGFGTVLLNSSYGDAYKGAQAFMQMRTDTVAGFVETVKEAAGDGIIISCALMPEPIEDTFSKCLYGQDVAKLAKTTDYVVPMAYASQYQKTSSWPASLAEKCAAAGANVVVGEQAFDETYTSNASDLNAEIPQIMAKAETVNANTSYGDIMGYAFFRGALMTIGSATYNEDDATLDIYVGNQTSTSDTKHVFKLQNGMTVDTSKLTNGFSNKTGYKSGASFTVSSDKKTITISNSGSAILGGTSQASFTVAVKGTPSTTYGAVQLTSYYGSSYKEGKSFCVTKGVDAGVYDGIVKGTCGDTHSAIETWTDGNGKHFAFCYNCLTDLTENCIVETVETDGYTSYECVGGLNPTTNLIDVDAHSATGGCGYSYVAADSLSMHFNAGEISDETADWKKTAAGTITAEVDNSKGILYGTISGYDPYVCTQLGSEAAHYNIGGDDIVEVRIKMDVTTGPNTGFQVFFTTSSQTTYNETYSVANHKYVHTSGDYQVIQLPFDASRAYVGQTLTSLRIDPLGVPKDTESSATYEIDYIYIGPASAAPSAQNTSELYFDFDSSASALRRYSSTVYGNLNFDKNTEGYWATADNGSAKNYSIDNEAGTISVNVGAGADANGIYGPWLETTNTYGAYPWSSDGHQKYYPLSYIPTSADYVQMRFKLNGCVAAEGKTPVLALIYDYIDDGAYGTDGALRAEINMDAEGYQIATIELDDKFTGVDMIKSLGFRFQHLLSSGDGTIIIDYIYVGAKDRLYFGFENTEEDQQRYTSKTYGNHNFDNGNWFGRTASVGELTYDNEAGTLSFTSSDATQSYHYVQTSDTGHTTDTLLRYVPSAGDTLQLRFKIENAAVNGTPAVIIHYMTDERTQIANDAVTKLLLDETYLDGEYHLLNLPLDASFTEATFISALRIGFEGISTAADTAAKFTIDYAYVGQPENLPTQNKLFFDFTADKEAEYRYATDTYGKTNFDTTDNWLAGNLTDKAIVNGDLTGTITANSYIRTAIGGSTSGERCPLQYMPGAEDYLQVRFKIDGTTATKVLVKLHYYVNEQAEWLSVDSVTYDIASGYMVATIALADTTFATAEQINGIQVAFNGVTDGTLSVDYVFVGPKAELPVSEKLYFDFANTEADCARYDSKTYGNLNYDDSENLQWKTLTTGLVAANTSINNDEGILVAAPAQDDISSICVDSTMNLIYDLSQAETMQLRLKLENFALIDGKNPYLTIQFFNDSGVLGSTDAITLTSEQLNATDFSLFTVDLTDEIRACGVISKLRLYFGNVSGNMNSKVTTDFIYIGTEKKLPVQDTLLFDFVNRSEDRDRYSSKTYGDVNYDTGNWKFNALRNEDPVFDNVAGTMSTKVVGSSPYLQTVGISGSMASAPLTYAPNGNAQVVQIRMKLENIAPVVEGTNGQIVVYLMTAAGEEVVTDTSLRYNLKTDDLNGEYFTINLNAEDYMNTITTIYAIRISAVSLQAIEGEESNMVIDYIYIGDKINTPDGAVCFVDFIGNDGDTVVQHSVVSDSGKAEYTGAMPEREPDENNHYTFSGWIKLDGTKVDLSSYSFTEDTVLYPDFTAIAHTLKYVENTDDSGITAKMHACFDCDYMMLSDHIWDEGKITSSSSCTAAGVKTYTCSLCAVTKTEALGSTGHTLVKDAAVAATCEADGLTEGSHCSACNAIIVAQKVVPATGHSFDGGVVTKEATCLESGEITYTCSGCHATKTETIETSGHDLIAHARVEATCMTDGNSAYFECSDCGKCYIDADAKYQIPLSFVVVEKTGHSLTYYAAKAATCSEEGHVQHYACGNCGKYYIDANATYEIPASYIPLEKKNHSYTYTNNGNDHTVGCANCDYSATEAHSYTDDACICGATESTEPEAVYDKNLVFNMSISVGAEMKVNYSFLASTVNSYKDFYIVVSKEVAGADPIVTIFGEGEGRTPMTVKTHPTTGEVLMYQLSYEGINAKEMGDVFSTTLYAVEEDGTVRYGKTNDSSIKSFLLSKIDAADSSAELKTMCVDMLKYGAAAQTHLNYNADKLVTADLTAAQLAYATKTTPEAVDYSASSGSGRALTASITVTSKVRLNLFCVYTPTGTGTLRCLLRDADGNMLAVLPVTVKSNVMCSAVYEDVGAKEMRDVVTATFYEDATAISETVSWSVESYVAQTRAKSNVSESELNMVNAMLTYGDAVAAYMEAK